MLSSSINGAILIDKPRGMTSHDVVARLRRLAGIRQIGHTGTLDPMADGLLILCLGQATRVAQFLVGLDKAYVGTITLGSISSTYDGEGLIMPQNRTLPAGAEAVRRAMARQVGELIQLPPAYSAVKVRGKKLYEYARAGEPVPQKPRPVRILRFDLLRYSPPEAHFEARVGSGAYIRSLAHDLGVALGCGAYLSRLRRTQVGGFSVEQATLLETLLAEPAQLTAHLLSITEALGHLPKVTIHSFAEKAILNGCAFSFHEVLEFDGILTPGQPVLVLSPQGRPLAVSSPEPEAAQTETAGDEDLEVTEEVDEMEGEPVIGATQMTFKPIRVLNQI